MSFNLKQTVSAYHRAVPIFAVLGLALSLSSPSNADEETETYDGIIIEQAFVQTNQVDPYPRLSLNISNLTSGDLTLTGISTEWFETAEILVRVPEKGLVEAGALFILQEETLELDTSHIVVELRNLKRPIKKGDKIEFNLLFADQTIPVLADIHVSNS